MPGLYNKANEILTNNHTLNDAGAGSIVFDEKSGISKEDQKDIIENINQIMQSSKIKAAPDLFRIKARKKGVGFPFLVNLVLLTVLAAGVLVRWYFFQNEETSIASGASKAGSGSGKAVIEELKRRAQADLARKDQEILNAQGDLKRVNEDLNALKENMDSRVAEREQQIRDQYAAQLQSERDKLVAAGTASADVEKRVKELEAEQRRLLQAEMERIVTEAENDRRLKEQALLDQKNQYTVRLDAIQQERRDISAAYQKELLKQEENLAAAEQQLRSLAAQKDKFDLINGQIVGFYTVIQTDIAGGRYDEARGRLKDLRDYFNQPDIIAVPEVARRRDVEFFTIDSLDQLVVANQRQAVLDAQSTQAAAAEAKLITKIRQLVLQADEAYRAGNKTRADGLYLQALELIPEINKSYRYFSDRVVEIETFRKTQVATALASAATNFRARRYEAALADFGKALEYLPTDQNTARLLNEIKTAGYEVEKTRLTQDDTTRAAARLKQGNDLFASGDYDKAGAVYLEILKAYPRVPPAGEAAVQLEKTIRLKDEEFSRQMSGLQNADSAGVAEYKKEIEVLKKTVADREAELAALRAQSPDARELEALKKDVTARELEIAELRKTAAEREKEIASLKSAAPAAAELTALKKTLADREAELAVLKAQVKDTTELEALKKSVAEKEKEIAALQGTLQGSRDELRKSLEEERDKIKDLEEKLARERKLSADYRKLQTEYASYSRNEDTVVRTGKLEELVISKSYLDSFLSSTTVQSAFPGLLERIKRYDRAFEVTGRQSAIQETVLIIQAANRLKTKAEKVAYLRKRLAGLPGTDPMAVLLKSLIDLTSG